jgi:cystathionine beta-lyase/cystathionine gamma-synthase
MQTDTKILHTKVDTGKANPNVTPVYQCSSFISGGDYFYTRKSNPNSDELEMVFREFEDAEYAVTVTTGMTALATTLNLLHPGDHLIVNKLIYGCSYNLFKIYCEDKHVELEVMDLSSEGVESRVKSNTKMILFETPTNPFLKTINIQQISSAAKKKNPGVLIVVDNTWATPLFQRPLQWGADISVYSATKYYSGHSDVMGGVIVTNNSDIAEKLYKLRFYSGAILPPYSAWLIRRSMQTLCLRLRHHQTVTLEIKKFLEGSSYIKDIYYPEVDGIQLTGYATLIFFTFKEQYKNGYEEFISRLKLFEPGTSMACVVCAVAQPYTGSHLSMSPGEKEEVGLTKSLVRLSFGLENIEDIKKDLSRAFKALDK